MKSEERALFENVTHGNVSVVEELLTLKIDANLNDDSGMRLLHWAVLSKKNEIVKALIKAGAKVDLLNKKKETPLFLFLAQMFGDDPAIGLNLIEAGADVNRKRSPKAWSPLHWVVYKDCYPLIRAILQQGGGVNDQENKDKYAPIHMAKSGLAGKTLIEFGANVNMINKEGLSPLETALAKLRNLSPKISKPHLINLCKILIEAGADCNKVAPNDSSVLMSAIESGFDDLAILMIERGANLTFYHPQAGGIIHVAAASQNSYFLERVIEAGVDCNLVQENGGDSPLHCAVAGNCIKNIELLLSKGAKPLLANNYGEGPIDYAEGDDGNKDEGILKIFEKYINKSE